MTNTSDRPAAGRNTSVLRCAALRTRRRARFVPFLVLSLIAMSNDGPEVSAQPQRQAQVLPQPPAARNRAQVQVLLQQGRRVSQGRRGRTPAVLIELSSPIANLFRRADEGIGRGDWKFAIDCLQRIVDDPQGSLIIQEGASEDSPNRDEAVLYETARRRALRQLMSLPEDGLRAYRLLHDARAKRLLERGISQSNRRMLRTVFNRYPLTQYGDDAADRLASWALDAGRAGEAVVLLTDLMELEGGRDEAAKGRRDGGTAEGTEGRRDGDTTVERSTIAAKLAVAYASLGRTDEAKAVLDAFRDSGDVDVGSVIAATSDALFEFVPLAHTADGGASNWPMIGGTPDRRGWMPLVDPALPVVEQEIAQRVPWQADLPGAVVGAWRRVLHDEPNVPLRLPVKQAVVAHGQLMARTRSGCVALDMVSLGRRWTAEDPGFVSPVVSARRQLLVARNQRVAAKRIQDAKMFDDHLTGGLSVGAGLVFTVSRSGRSTYTQGESDAGRGLFVPQFHLPGRPTAPLIGTRIVAYDEATGALRWERGRTANVNDPLADVVFQSVPLPLEGVLWVSYVRNNDLYVAVLEPSDGRLIRQTLLCSLNLAELDSLKSYPLAAADGVIYVPTGHGILFAMDASDYTLRWANQYSPDLLAGHDGRMVEGSWLPGPPVVTGGLVLLTPTEERELLAFSAATGRLEWMVPGGGNSYVMAADQDHVWLGGRTLSCLSLNGGDELWSVDVPSTPTGRAAVCGDLVHVPLLSGLWTLDANTGVERSLVPLTESDEPLGTLLCADHSLYAVSRSTIRRFPDIGRTYPIVRELVGADPSDQLSAVRLAWLELLRGDPRAAKTVLDGLQVDAVSAGDAAQSVVDELARVRVEVLLALSALPDVAGHDALALIKEARLAAHSPEDRLRCGSALVDLLVSLSRSVDALRQLWTMMQSSDANQVVALSAGTKGMARFDIARRYRIIRDTLSAGQRKEWSRFLREQVDAMVASLRDGDQAGETADRMRAMIDLTYPHDPAPRVALALAGAYARHLQYESADYLLRAVVSTGTNETFDALALMHLARLYDDVYEQGIDATAAMFAALNELAARFGSDRIPDLGPEPPGSAKSDGLAASGTVLRDWVRVARSAVSAESNETYGEDSKDDALELVGTLAWAHQWAPGDVAARMVTFADPSSGVLVNRVLLQGLDDIVTCYDAADFKIDERMLWRANLRLPGTFPEDGVSARAMKNLRRQAVTFGQTVVVNGVDGMFAVGLLTGRRLWVHPFELAGPADEPVSRDRLMAGADGWIAAMPKTGRLSLMRMLDGFVVWERDLRGETADHVRMSGDRVITIDKKLERVHLFDRATGDLVRRVLFRQPHPDAQLIDLVTTGSSICGPISDARGDSIRAVDLKTGKTLWTRESEKPIVQLFKPKDGYLGVGMLGGDVQLLDADSGEPLVSWRLAETKRVLGGVLVDGTLVVQYATSANRHRFHKLAALDVATGEELWRRDDVLSLSRTGEPIRVVGGRLLGLIAPARNDRRGTRLTMIDVRSGSDVSPPVALKIEQRDFKFNGDFAVHRESGVVVIGAENSLLGVRIRSAGRIERGGL